MEVYGYGASTWDGAINTGDSRYPWQWFNKTWDDGCSGPRCDGGPPKVRWNEPLLPGAMTHGGIEMVSLRSKREFQLASWRGWYDWATCWRTGVIEGCTAAASGCMRVKAGFPACFATWCIGAEVGSGVACAL